MLSKKGKTCLGKYGTDHPMKLSVTKENHKQTCLKRFGVDHYSKTKEFSSRMKSIWTAEKLALRTEKTKQTCLRKYGVDNPFKLKSTTEKIKSTKLKKYNDINYNNREVAKNTCLEKYGVQHPIQNKDIRLKMTNTRTEKFVNRIFNGSRLNHAIKPLFIPNDFKTVHDLYPFSCNSCHIIFMSNIEDGRIPRCPACSPPNNISFAEMEFLDYIGIITEDRQKYIKPYKVDGIRGNKIFEFFGDYWHGNPKLFPPHEVNSSNKIKFGDLFKNTTAKLQSLNDRGYDIYYIWENDWNLWKKNKLSIFPLRKYKNGNL